MTEDETLRANERSAAGMCYGHGRAICAGQNLNAERKHGCAPNFRADHAHGRDDLGADSGAFDVGAVVGVLQNQAVKTGFGVDRRLGSRCARNLRDGRAPARRAWQRRGVNHADQSARHTEQPSDDAVGIHGQRGI